MNYKLFNPKAVAADILDGISLKNKTLAVFTSSFDPACEVYIRSLIKAIMPRGGDIVIRQSDPAHCAKGFISQIEDAARDRRINGILVLKPLPDGVSEDAVRAVLPPEKDVDGFGLHWLNVKAAGAAAEDFFSPCVCTAAVELLKSESIELEGKRVVIVNDRKTLGQPLGICLREAGAEVSFVSLEHGSLSDLKDKDIVISAAGKADLITGDLIKDGAMLIDLGLSPKTVTLEGVQRTISSGDMAESCFKKASFISSPALKNGIGALTTAVLVKNLASTK